MYQISNIYGITAIAVIGGGLFGFDISSMSAMYVVLLLRNLYRSLTFVACPLSSIDAISTKVPMGLLSPTRASPAQAPRLMSRAALQLPCPEGPS